jgi:peptide/nickel transport system substrate-binding protein
MSKTLTRILSLAMALVMVFALVGCGKTETPAESAAPATQAPAEDAATLVVGYAPFSQKFSPFFSKTQYDQDAALMTQLSLLGSDREGNVILNGIEGETVAYNGTDYNYTGIADIAVVQNDDGTVDYNITLKDGIVFSDGEPMTIDDVIFNMYVYSDPTYDGSATFYSLPIEGMTEYRAGMDTLSNLILAAGPDNTDFTSWTEEQQTTYWTAFTAAGEKFAQEILDYCVANGYNAEGDSVATIAANWGYTLADDATAADFFQAMIDNYGYDVSDAGINVETAGTAITDFINAELGDKAASYAAGVSTGESVPNISGITKTGDNTITVHCTKFEATSIYQFAMPIAPMHYYGDASLYDYDNNMFGFTKGDMSIIKSKTTQPMGAGAYKFVSYENGVITFEANASYWKGEPKIKYILFKETDEGDKLGGIVSGTFDITDPTFSTSVVESIKGYNSNGDLTGDVITTNTVDNLGYGYIGICAYNVKVGDDSASTESKDLRKAFATLFSVYRDTAINSYYGERATVIQYPISNTSWAAPRPADDGYMLAYSVDVDGNAIYTDSMSEQERYDAALQASIGFFKAAGYTWDEATGKFTAAPDGAKMNYEVIIPGDGTGNHPDYGILTAAKEALASVGITLDINDPTDSNVLWNALEAVPATAEMWAAAWQATADPDMYQVYHSTNINGAGGTNSNHYYIADDTLDELIIEARSSADQSFRKATYKQALETILDWGVELPCYQRQNAVIFSSERVNMSTVTPDITTFWGWMNDIELIEMN